MIASMFRHVLLPVDLTEKCRSAVEVGAELAQLAGARLTLLHVIEPIADAGDDDDVADFYRELETRAHERLEALRGELAARSFTVDAHVTVADRAEEIVRFADETAVDLVVMTSRRLDPAAPPSSAWPTGSHRVALLSHLPVLLVR